MSEKHGDGNNISAAHSINTLKTAAGRSRAIGHSANHGKHEVAAAGGSLNLMPSAPRNKEIREPHPKRQKRTGNKRPHAGRPTDRFTRSLAPVGGGHQNR